jgi:hypothetical protein
VDSSYHFVEWCNQRFHTIEQAKTAFESKCLELGFVVNIKHSYHNPKSGRLMSITTYCDRGRKPSKGQEKSKRQGCKFLAIIRFDRETRLFKVDVVNATHNHAMIPPEVPGFHITRELKMMIRELKWIGASSSQIIEHLKRRNIAIVSFRDIASFSQGLQGGLALSLLAFSKLLTH